MKNELTGYHVVSISPPEGQGWLSCKEWCLSMIEPRAWRYVGEGVFEFVREQDAVTFRVRWA